MVTTNSNDAEDRQVLVSVGNRYVLFGSEAKLPSSRAFGPEDIKEPLPRVPDEREVSEERLIKSLLLSGVKITPPPPDAIADLAFTDRNGQQVLVEIKVRERDTWKTDFERFQQEFENTPSGFKQEVWNFNLERLHLEMFELDKGRLKRATSLHPLDVWEFDADGSMVNRAHVLERVVDWENRINGLYDKVTQWAKDAGFRTERTRKVLMSEELMQKFAIPDRELSVLDIVRETQTAASFVPIGLWLIGFNGRINIATRTGTHILADPAGELGKPEWALVSREKNRRQFSPFDEAAFAELMRTA
jgi:hypothetical protein